jgi:tripartite-type tricarboxylate transporter receptor subunit TctC
MAWKTTIPVITGALLGALAGAAQARDQIADFYHGRTVTIVSGSPGGGYDTYARLVARYLGRHVPGAPTVVVTDMEGAGGGIAGSYVARVAAKDGTFISAPQPGALLAPILNPGSVNFDPSRVKYLGSANSDVFLCVTRRDASISDFAETFSKPVTMGGASADGYTGYLPTLLNNVVGTKFKVVLGYKGMGGLTLALRNKEIEGICGFPWTILRSQYSDLLTTGEVHILVQENAKGLDELNRKGVPLTASYAKDAHARAILDIIYSQEAFAFPYFVAQEVPPDRLAALRRAFMETLRDPDLLRAAERMNFEIMPMSGLDVQQMLEKIYRSPPSLLHDVKAAIEPHEGDRPR